MELNLTTVRPHLVFECVCGSTAYNLTVSTSDIDKRGVYFVSDMIPRDNVLFQRKDLSQDLVKDERGDTQYYRLDKFMKLAAAVNPSLVEMLFMPEEHIIVNSDEMRLLIDHRRSFVSAKARESFSGYAMEQIKKAKGQNKWVNNPQPEKIPSKMDFTWIIPMFSPAMAACWDCNYPEDEKEMNMLGFPARPIPAREYNDGRLDNCVVAKLEHAQNMYRIYEGGNGIFRGPNEQLVMEPISKHDEFARFRGLMIFNEQEWKKAVNNWKQYWAWRRDRNEARWVTQESGEMDYDCKNMMHCLRTLMSGINILERGEPIIKWTGNGQKVLMDIRLGKYRYDDIMKIVDEYDRRLKEIDANVPDDIDYDMIDELYCRIIEMNRRKQ